MTFRGVAKRFGDVAVLDALDLDVRAGEVVALIGPSGAGKSTLLRLVNGLETRDAGALSVLDVEVPLSGPAADPASRWWLALRRRIGFVFQAFHLHPHLTAIENLTLAPTRVHGWERARADERARALLARVGVEGKAGALPAALSGGQQQRVAIARAMMMDPEIVLFDEPTSALDPEMTAEVLDAVRDLATERRRTILVVTHELGFAREVADRVAFLADGRVLEVGAPGDVLEAPRHPRTRAFLDRVLALRPRGEAHR